MSDAPENLPGQSTASTSRGKLLICPYCGDAQPILLNGAERCRSCAGLFEPLSRQATHNAMGPWFVRDPNRPFQPGCSYETLMKLVQRGRITRLSIVRGPTTRQFWTIAKRVPGIAHLLGYCHECNASVDPGDHGCHACGVTFGAFLDRNFLGLPEYRPLPWEAPRSADDPAARTWHGLPTIREEFVGDEGSPRGLSSFATDEELRGQAANAAQSASGGSGDDALPQTVTADPQLIVSAPALSPKEERNLEVSARLMRRRVARQQRAIHRLTVLATALALFALVALVGWVSGTFDRRAATPAEAEQQSSTTAQPNERDATLNDDPNESAPLEPDELEPPPITDSSADNEAADEPDAADLQREFERAAELLEQSRDEGRELSDRIAAAEEAIAILVAIQASAQQVDLPEGLAELAQEAERQLERLRLREFFP